MLELGIKILLSYLLGTIMGGVWVGKLRGAADLRTVGSGNLGATNALRQHGKSHALAVLAIDIGKGVLAVLWLPSLALPGIAGDPGWSEAARIYACGLAVIAGHVWPLWHDFRGGKGAATAMGVTLVLAPWLALPLLGAWIATIALTGYVGLATILTALAAPLLVALGYPTPHPGFFWFALPVGLLMTYTHRQNIARMLAGTEKRMLRGLLNRQRF